MSPTLAVSILGICALSAVTGCGKRAPGTANTGNACDRKLLTVAEVSGILSEPITGTESVPGDLQSCRFATGVFPSVTVTLRPGLGRVTVETWTSGRMPVSATPLPAVGDEAVWAESLTEVIAEKNDLLCDIQVNGLAGVLHHEPAADRQKAIGALCNKIFTEVQ